jgi:hypothetical protein
MRVLWILLVLALAAFEIAGVYFIMPLPGSQRMRSLSAAYALYQSRWIVRGALGVTLAAVTIRLAPRPGRFRWVMPVLGTAVGALIWFVNFRMAADQMFRQPTVVRMANSADNRVALDRLVVGIEINGDARAYPLQFIGYHHQVRDSVGGQPVLVSYCTVCRTGRVFTPVVDGQLESFRLVGMDHFNAMLEDVRTGSWWRQANGEAVVGPRLGTVLPEIPSRQVTLGLWLSLYPHSRVMQGDPAFAAQYAKDYAYERGTSTSRLTGTDRRSWQDKSWVIGLTVEGKSRAYDWQQLLSTRAINDTLGGVPVVLALATDRASFFAFVRPSAALQFTMDGDSLSADGVRYALNGRSANGALTPIKASQEFWHSWRTFQPTTDRYLGGSPAPAPAAAGTPTT